MANYYLRNKLSKLSIDNDRVSDEEDNDQDYAFQLNEMRANCEHLEDEVERLQWHLEQMLQAKHQAEKQCNELNHQLKVQRQRAPPVDASTAPPPQAESEAARRSVDKPPAKDASTMAEGDRWIEREIQEAVKAAQDQEKASGEIVRQELRRVFVLEQEKVEHQAEQIDQLREQIRARSKIHENELRQLEDGSAGLKSRLAEYREMEDDWNRIRTELSEEKKQLIKEKQELEDKIVHLEQKIVAERTRPVSRIVKIRKYNEVKPDIEQENQELVNGLRNEAQRWRTYAEYLVQNLTTHCPAFKNKHNVDKEGLHFTTDKERQWYKYAMYLLKILVEVAPDKLLAHDWNLWKSTKTGSTPLPDAVKRFGAKNTYVATERTRSVERVSHSPSPVSLRPDILTEYSSMTALRSPHTKITPMTRKRSFAWRIKGRSKTLNISSPFLGKDGKTE